MNLILPLLLLPSKGVEERPTPAVCGLCRLFSHVLSRNGLRIGISTIVGRSFGECDAAVNREAPSLLLVLHGPAEEWEAASVACPAGPCRRNCKMPLLPGVPGKDGDLLLAENSNPSSDDIKFEGLRPSGCCMA